MAISCDPNDLMQAANCLNSCVPPGMHSAIQTYLLQQIAGNTMTTDELMDAARCFAKCIPKGEMAAIQVYLMCQIVNSA